MAVLQRSMKPEVQFDASNKEHRNAYYTFLYERKWKDNIRFLLEEPYTSIPLMIADRLLFYYMDMEFKNVGK